MIYFAYLSPSSNIDTSTHALASVPTALQTEIDLSALTLSPASSSKGPPNCTVVQAEIIGSAQTSLDPLGAEENNLAQPNLGTSQSEKSKGKRRL